VFAIAREDLTPLAPVSEAERGEKNVGPVPARRHTMWGVSESPEALS
jgi:hypothetical protein